MPESRLQSTEIPLRKFDNIIVRVEPNGASHEVSRRECIALRVPGPPTVHLSPEEAHSVGSSLVDHAEECGYDADSGETRVVE